MRADLIDDSTGRAAASAVMEYVTLALGPDFLRWTKDVNLDMAVFIWNLGPEHPSPRLLDQNPALQRLHSVLSRARRRRFREFDFVLCDLDVRPSGGDIVVTFDLSWDEGQSCKPFHMTWERLFGAPRNARRGRP